MLEYLGPVAKIEANLLVLNNTIASISNYAYDCCQILNSDVAVKNADPLFNLRTNLQLRFPRVQFPRQLLTGLTATLYLINGVSGYETQDGSENRNYGRILDNAGKRTSFSGI